MSKDYEEFIKNNTAKASSELNEEIQVTIDISMYPNKDEFIEPINGFIKIINTFPEIKVKTFPTSTVIQGEYAYTMKAAQDAISEAHTKFDKAVYVMKVIPDYEAL